MLKCHGLEDADIAALTTENSVSQCKKCHSGPGTNKEELHELIKLFTGKGKSHRRSYTLH